MHVCTSFFPVPQVSNKTIYIFYAPVPQKQAKIRGKKIA